MSHGIILPLLWASTDSTYRIIFVIFFYLPSLDVAALYKDPHACVKRFVSNLLLSGNNEKLYVKHILSLRKKKGKSKQRSRNSTIRKKFPLYREAGKTN